MAAELRRAFAGRLVLSFRDRHIDHEALKAFGRRSGELHVATASAAWAVPGHPEVVRIHADAQSRYVAGEDWHSTRPGTRPARPPAPPSAATDRPETREES